MQAANITENTLCYGDNLDILRQYISNESVDLIYLDPPFNSKRDHNVLFDETGVESKEQIMAFEDTWHWNHKAEETYHEIITQAPSNVSQMIAALRSFVGASPMMAYLVMMTPRLVELHRVLKPTGSLYLHCDSTASHYLKIILDTIFGAKNFRNEIIWKRFNFHADANRFGKVTDRILFYTRSENFTFNRLRVPFSEEYQTSKFTHIDENGRRFRLSDLNPPGGRGPIYEFNGVKKPWRVTEKRMKQLEAEGRIYTKSRIAQLKRYLDELEGQVVHELWSDIKPVNPRSNERLGYPTQKPLALLERIIQASSNPGDIILDPFCGCGTAVEAAQKLGRRWIGIDIAHLAVTLQICRLESISPGIRFQTINYPKRMSEAKDLAQQDLSHFRYWALGLVRAWPHESPQGKVDKKRLIDGIDGTKPFLRDHKHVLIQVKHDRIQSDHIHHLVDIIEREQSAMGALLTLEPPSHTLLNEAANAGLYRASRSGQEYPKIQIITIQDALDGKSIDMPQDLNDFKDVG